MVKRGDYSGCSFEFWPGDYDKVVDGNDVTIIHKRFEFISALTIGMDPAYRQTTVNVRELEETKRENEPDAEEEERKRKEAEEKAVREYRERLRRIQLNESIDELDY
jgi:phage head maturation protease